MANELHGRRVAILAADGVEQVELVQPREALTDAGAQVHLLSLEAGEIQAMNHDIEPAATSSTAASRSRRSATAHGCSSRPTS